MTHTTAAPRSLHVCIDLHDTLIPDQVFHKRAEAAMDRLLKGNFSRHLADVEDRNIRTNPASRTAYHYGYGDASYAASFAEAFFTYPDFWRRWGKRASFKIILSELLDNLRSPRVPLPGVLESLTRLKPAVASLHVITQGDAQAVHGQIASTTLQSYFDSIEIVSRKSAETFIGLAERNQWKPADCVMIGNGLGTDVLSARMAGWHAYHIPSEAEWCQEDDLQQHPLYQHFYDQQCRAMASNFDMSEASFMLDSYIRGQAHELTRAQIVNLLRENGGFVACPSFTAAVDHLLQHRATLPQREGTLCPA